jgi:tol-pal system protein YbgF
MRGARYLLIAVSAAAMSVGACAHRADYVARDEYLALGERVLEIEETNGRYRARIDELEERVFLLQDRLEASRLAMERRFSGGEGVVTIAPGRSGGTSISSVPSASAPPARDYVDALTALPVQRLTPDTATVGSVGGFEPPPADYDASEEIVIDMDAYYARFGSDGGTNTTRSATGTGGTGGAAPTTERRAQPPVDVGSDRLPVAPLDGSQTVGVAVDSVSPLAMYRAAIDLFNAGEYTQALAQLTSFVETNPEADYMDNALFWMGECYYGLGRYSDALGLFQRVVSEYPDGNKVPDSLLKVALCYERVDNPASAREVLTVLTATYPSTDAARRAEERLRALQ